MRLPRLAPRLLVSLPLCGLVLAARVAGQGGMAAAFAAALIGAMLAPARGAGGIIGTSAAAGLLAMPGAASAGIAEAILAALPLAGNVALAWHFGTTLRRGREPLIARYTRFEHAEVPAGLVRYARRLTQLWTLFFLLFAAANAATLAGHWPPAGPAAALNAGLALAFFLGEHLVRRALFPELGPVRVSRTLRTIWRMDALPDAR